jgi:hypothetical protein
MNTTEMQTRTETRSNEIKTWLYDHDSYFDFSVEEHWKTLVDHIDFHKYIMEENKKRSIGWDDALRSWKENVMEPLKHAVDTYLVRTAFPRQKFGDLYLAVSDHWYYLKQWDSRVTPESAAKSFAAHYGNFFGRFFSRFLDYPVINTTVQSPDGWESARRMSEQIRNLKDEYYSADEIYPQY